MKPEFTNLILVIFGSIMTTISSIVAWVIKRHFRQTRENEIARELEAREYAIRRENKLDFMLDKLNATIYALTMVFEKDKSIDLNKHISARLAESQQERERLSKKPNS